jgi:hypothetical protein
MKQICLVLLTAFVIVMMLQNSCRNNKKAAVAPAASGMNADAEVIGN